MINRSSVSHRHLRNRNSTKVLYSVIWLHQCTKMQTIATNVPVACRRQSLCNLPAPCRSYCKDRGSVCGGNSWGPKEHCFRRVSISPMDSMRPLQNYFGHLLLHLSYMYFHCLLHDRLSMPIIQQVWSVIKVRFPLERHNCPWTLPQLPCDKPAGPRWFITVSCRFVGDKVRLLSQL